MSGKRGLVLLVHGSTSPEWMQSFELMADAVREQVPDAEVSLACLQKCKPDLQDALAGLAEKGLSEIVVLPVFISALGHVLKDVPAIIEAARVKFPGLKITVTHAIGEQPEVSRALVESMVRLAGNSI